MLAAAPRRSPIPTRPRRGPSSAGGTGGPPTTHNARFWSSPNLPSRGCGGTGGIRAGAGVPGSHPRARESPGPARSVPPGDRDSPSSGSPQQDTGRAGGGGGAASPGGGGNFGGSRSAPRLGRCRVGDTGDGVGGARGASVSPRELGGCSGVRGRGGGSARLKAEIGSLPSTVGSPGRVLAAPPGHAAPDPRRPGGSVPARSPGGGERGGPGTGGHRLRSSGGGRARLFLSPPTPPKHTLPAPRRPSPPALLISSPKGAPSPPRPPVNPWEPGAPQGSGGGGGWWGPGSCKATSEPSPHPQGPPPSCSCGGEEAPGAPCRVRSRFGTAPCWESLRGETLGGPRLVIEASGGARGPERGVLSAGVVPDLWERASRR